MAVETKIEDVQAFLNEHDEVHIENAGRFEILTANKHGVLQVGDESKPRTVSIDDEDVTLY